MITKEEVKEEELRINMDKKEQFLKNEAFLDLLKHSEKSAERLWNNQEDEIWNYF